MKWILWKFYFFKLIVKKKTFNFLEKSQFYLKKWKIYLKISKLYKNIKIQKQNEFHATHCFFSHPSPPNLLPNPPRQLRPRRHPSHPQKLRLSHPRTNPKRKHINRWNFQKTFWLNNKTWLLGPRHQLKNLSQILSTVNYFYLFVE